MRGVHVGPAYGVAITRTSMCTHCNHTIHYSPLADQWWHRHHGGMRCRPHIGTLARPKENIWREETGRVGDPDDEDRGQRLRTPLVPSINEHGNEVMVEPQIRVVNGAVVMDG